MKKEEKEAVRMSYYEISDLKAIAAAKVLDDLAKIAIRVIEQMPGPAIWVGGPVTAGRRTIKENRDRLHKVILYYKRRGELAFNYLILEKKAREILERQFGSGRLPRKAQEKLRDEFYAPIFRSGLIKRLYLLNRWDSSLNARWMSEFAKKAGIPVLELHEEVIQFLITEPNVRKPRS